MVYVTAALPFVSAYARLWHLTLLLNVWLILLSHHTGKESLQFYQTDISGVIYSSVSFAPCSALAAVLLRFVSIVLL
nr:MAG TPA: hypothetical protein [Caudoviricetes sp.]